MEINFKRIYKKNKEIWVLKIEGMDLFGNLADANENLLPKDGTVNYYGKIIDQEEADAFYLQLLENIEWKNDEAVIFGKKILTKRKVAWFGDQPYEYTYSKRTKFARRTSESNRKLVCNRYKHVCSESRKEKREKESLHKGNALARVSKPLERYQ